MDIIGGQGPSRHQPDAQQQGNSSPEGVQPQGVAFRSDMPSSMAVDTPPPTNSTGNLATLADSLNNQTPNQPNQPTSPQAEGGKPKKKKGKALRYILFSLLAILLLGGAGAAGFFLGVTQGKSAGYDQGKRDALTQYQRQIAEENEETEETPTPDQEVPDDIPNKLTLGREIDPEYKDENIEGVIGRQIAASDGLVMMVTSIERNFKADDANYKLASGKELVKVNFLLGNNAKDKAKDVNSFNFRLLNSKGAQLTPESISKYENKFDTVKIDKKGQVSLAIVYAVDKDEKPISFTRIQTYRITNQNKEVTTKMTVVLDK